jgi:hypothetical protein
MRQAQWQETADRSHHHLAGETFNFRVLDDRPTVAYCYRTPLGRQAVVDARKLRSEVIP